MTQLVNRRFRANSALRLVELQRLGADERRALTDTTLDPESFGVLLASDASPQTSKVICKQTALLFYALTDPGPLPAYIHAQVADTKQSVAREVLKLVIEGILEIELDGRYVSGSEASSLLEPVELPEPTSRLAALSLQAIQYAQQLPWRDVGSLSAQLYFYHRSPITSQRLQVTQELQNQARYLGLEGGGRSASVLQGYWRAEESANTPGWLCWVLRDRTRAALSPHGTNRYKLYISPTFTSFPDCLPTVIEVLGSHGVPYFKIGKGAGGLLRPDKCVAYSEDFEQLRRAARDLESLADRHDAQGVPFTAELHPSGLLSWAADPLDTAIAGMQIGSSWRTWICHHIAVALRACIASREDEVRSTQFALQRLTMLGVDVQRWAPTTAFLESHRRRNPVPQDPLM